MKKAVEIMKTGRYLIYQIANMVGYRNMAAFIKQFKEYYGVTPKEYQDRCLK